MLRLQAISVPDMPGAELSKLCLIWEEQLSPWLLPTQLRHLQAFGSSFQALKARCSRLLARHMALEQSGWENMLDRDEAGRSFFVPSSSPAAFAYAKDSVFCLCAPCVHGKDSLSIDAVNISELSHADLTGFMAKIYPSLRGISRFSKALMMAALWTAFESAYKILGKDALKIDIPRAFPHDFSLSANPGFYMPEADLHFLFLTSKSCMIALASRQAVGTGISCQWLAQLPSPPFIPLQHSLAQTCSTSIS